MQNLYSLVSRLVPHGNLDRVTQIIQLCYSCGYEGCCSVEAPDMLTHAGLTHGTPHNSIYSRNSPLWTANFGITITGALIDIRICQAILPTMPTNTINCWGLSTSHAVLLRLHGSRHNGCRPLLGRDSPCSRWYVHITAYLQPWPPCSPFSYRFTVDNI